MQEESVLSRQIPDFPNYYVLSDGRVINMNTSREMTLSPTMQGDYTVGLMKEGVQYRRSVKVLVAEAFVRGKTDIFDTPIQLNCIKEDLRVENIQWRPRWFAWKYARQFIENHPGWFYRGPILDTTNNIQYSTIFEAALANGNLCSDIRQCILTDTRVFPTGEQYIYV